MIVVGGEGNSTIPVVNKVMSEKNTEPVWFCEKRRDEEDNQNLTIKEPRWRSKWRADDPLVLLTAQFDLLTPCQQVRLMKSAVLVLGRAGADLTNVFFMRPAVDLQKQARLLEGMRTLPTTSPVLEQSSSPKAFF